MKNLDNTLDFQSDSMELQEMRKQLTLLNHKLGKEHILNERLMRKAMSKRISGYKKERWFILPIFLLIIPCFLFLSYKMNFSIAFDGATILYLIAAEVYNLYIWKPIDTHDFLAGDLCAVSKKLVKFQQQVAKWQLYAIPTAIVWFVWWMYEIQGTSNSDVHSVKFGLIGGGIVGGIIGAACGIWYYLRRKKAINETINDIKELMKA